MYSRFQDVSDHFDSALPVRTISYSFECVPNRLGRTVLFSAHFPIGKNIGRTG